MSPTISNTIFTSTFATDTEQQPKETVSAPVQTTSTTTTTATTTNEPSQLAAAAAVAEKEKKKEEAKEGDKEAPQ
ncbi:hypothetical protein QBC32DRAFT_312282 [Pseudoneurospora amorphoporcata]|uniref:Uncharacterized protein n=1 Tax=Pseudoneurospora amorphoporcata TaxID=241081 RepID=A0AAN6SIE2_9PEZI|nr:hypothetical protein QBC32DRAFT_312282 [Pseudoneurospora amorphoporcata]